MSLVILALFLIFIVTMTARYLNPVHPSAGTAAPSSQNLSVFENGTGPQPRHELEAAENQTVPVPVGPRPPGPSASSNRTG